MRDIAKRNADVKKVLAKAFGRDKVRVRGSRGTGYGHASVHIDYTPLDNDQATALREQCYLLLRAADVDLGSRYTDDTCQYTAPEVGIRFNTCRFYRTMRHSDGTMSVMRDYHSTEWEAA